MSWIHKETCSLVFKGAGYNSQTDFKEMVEDLFGDITIYRLGRDVKLRYFVSWSRSFKSWQITFSEDHYLHWKGNMSLFDILKYFKIEANDFDIEVESIIEILA